MIDGNDIWEALFGILRGEVPEELTEDVLEQLAAAFNALSAVPNTGDVDLTQNTILRSLFYAGWDAAIDWTSGAGCTEPWEAQHPAWVEFVGHNRAMLDALATPDTPEGEG